MKSSESHIVFDILNGNSKKYRLLIDRYAPMVFMIAQSFHDEEHEVEKLAEKIFVNAFNSLNSYDRQKSFSSWLYSLAINYCRSELGAQTKVHSVSGEQHRDVALNGVKSKKERSRKLREGLKYMRPELSEAFIMRYKENLSYESMSKRLGVKKEILQERVHSARKQIKKYMETPD